MDQDRAEKGLAQVAGEGLAAVGNERVQRREPEKGKAEDTALRQNSGQAVAAKDLAEGEAWAVAAKRESRTG